MSKKTTELSTTPTLVTTDLLTVVSNPAVTPVSVKAPISQVLALAAGGGGGRTWLSTNTALASNASSTLALTGISATYDDYEVVLAGMIPASGSATILIMDVSIDAGATWLSSGYRYICRYYGDANDFGAGGNSQSGTYFTLYGTVSTTGPGSGVMRLSVLPGFFSGVGRFHFWHANSNRYVFDTGCWQSQTVNALRYRMDVGNFAGGSIRLYGMSKT